MSDFERYARTAFKYIRRFLPRIIKFASRQYKQRKGKAGHEKPGAAKPHAAGPTNHGLPAKHGQQPAQHAAAAASAEHVEIGELKRYDSDLYDFKQLDAQGRRIFPEAEAFRDEAQKQAQLRGKAYDASKVAYSAGDGGEAKTLSNKGKEHGRLMEEANAAAVRAILEPQRYMETGCLDLHGLHVAEAEAASRDFVQQQLALRQFSEIEIITGAGHHSSGQVAKIK
eukprot:828-Heterococcus_DN1.PRE.1